MLLNGLINAGQYIKSKMRRSLEAPAKHQLRVAAPHGKSRQFFALVFFQLFQVAGSQEKSALLRYAAAVGSCP